MNQLPLLWKDICTIHITEKYTKPNGATGVRDAVLCTDEPCKLSFFNNFKMNDSASVGLNAAGVFQNIKLFIKPELDIPEGSKVTVTTHQNGKILHYKSSGTPSIFTNHQEIILEVDKEWA
jgi:hypothetical protein